MRIELRCRCGASAVFDDARETVGRLITDDPSGFRFYVERNAHSWLERHHRCTLAGLLELVDASLKRRGETPQ